MISSVRCAPISSIAQPFTDTRQEPRSDGGNHPADASDSFEHSAFATMLERLGLTSSSRPDAARDRVDFTVSFTASMTESLSASGFVALRERTAAMSLAYTFQRAVVEHGKREVKQFQATIDFDVRAAESLSVKPFREKEDIMLFLNRLMKDVFTLMQDDSVVLSGICLDQEDLVEILNFDHAKVKRLFDGLLSAIMTMAMLKRMKRGEHAARSVVLKEERSGSEGMRTEAETASHLSCSIDIQCLNPGKPADDTTAHMVSQSKPPMPAE